MEAVDIARGCHEQREFYHISKELCGPETLNMMGMILWERRRLTSGAEFLFPQKERERLGLRSGTEFELLEEKGMLLLKPIIPKPLRVRSGKGKWEGVAFLDAGEATFGE